MSERALNVLNMVRAAAGSEYQSRIPEATRTNITQVGNAITTYEPTKNMFLDILINKIGLTLIQNQTYQDRFRVFEKGRLTTGDTIESIYIQVTNGAAYTEVPADGASIDPFVVKRPSITVDYHKVDRRLVYEQTLADQELKEAFHDVNKMDEFLRKVIDNMYTSLNYDRYIMARELFGSEKLYPNATQKVNVGTLGAGNTFTEELAKNMLTQIKAYNYATSFMSENYNAAGVLTHTPEDRKVLIIRADALAYTDVNVLAGVFNLGRAQTDFSRIIVVDNFGTGTNPGDTAVAGRQANMIAALVDSYTAKFYTTIDGQFYSIHNPRGLYWNYFLHYWGLMSYELWGTAIAFTATAAAA